MTDTDLTAFVNELASAVFEHQGGMEHVEYHDGITLYYYTCTCSGGWSSQFTPGNGGPLGAEKRWEAHRAASIAPIIIRWAQLLTAKDLDALASRLATVATDTGRA